MKVKLFYSAEKSIFLILALGVTVALMIYRLSNSEAFQNYIDIASKFIIQNLSQLYAAEQNEEEITFNPLEESTEEEISILAQLSLRRKELDKKERKLRETGILILAAEKNLDIRMKGFKQLKSELTRIVQKIKKEEEKNVDDLVKMYQGMSVQQAASIFNELPLSIVRILLKKMKKKTAGLILASMDKKKAGDLTRSIMEQNVAVTS